MDQSLVTDAAWRQHTPLVGHTVSVDGFIDVYNRVHRGNTDGCTHRNTMTAVHGSRTSDTIRFPVRNSTTNDSTHAPPSNAAANNTSILCSVFLAHSIRQGPAEAWTLRGSHGSPTRQRQNPPAHTHTPIMDDSSLHASRGFVRSRSIASRVSFCIQNGTGAATRVEAVRADAQPRQCRLWTRERMEH